MAHLGVVYGEGFPALLTKLFTGTRAFHLVWETDRYIYDYHWTRRRRPKDEYSNKIVLYYNFGRVSEAYLEKRLKIDFGSKDKDVLRYLKFKMRRLYHLLGRSTVGSKGFTTCDVVDQDLKMCDYTTPFGEDTLPITVAAFERWLQK